DFPLDNPFVQSLLFGFISIFIRRLVWILSSGKIEMGMFNRTILVELLFFTLIFFITILISSLFDFADLYFLVFGILSIPFFLSFDFIIRPYFYDFFDRSSI